MSTNSNTNEIVNKGKNKLAYKLDMNVNVVVTYRAGWGQGVCGGGGEDGIYINRWGLQHRRQIAVNYAMKINI